MNDHDLEGFLANFHDDYSSEKPAHPERAFGGRAQVQENWAAMFRELLGISVRARGAGSRPGDAAMHSAKIATPMLQDFLDTFNAHDVDAIMSFFAEDCVLDMPRGPVPGGRRLVGKQQVREGIQSRLDGIPDIHYGDDCHWLCGDRGVSEWTLRGTQQTGEPIEVRGCDLFQFVAGKISRKDSFWTIVD